MPLNVQTFTANTLGTADSQNDQEANFQYLKDLEKPFATGTSEESTSSATFVDVDATNMKVDIDVQDAGSTIVISFTCYVETTTPGTDFADIDIDIGGTRWANTNQGIGRVGDMTNFSCTIFHTAAAAGVLTIKVKWRSSTGNAVYISKSGNTKWCLGARELIS